MYKLLTKVHFAFRGFPYTAVCVLWEIIPAEQISILTGYWLDVFCSNGTHDDPSLTWYVIVYSPRLLPGAPLKVCPQGFSCCTVEMEEKLSQQSHSEIKAPVSKLSTNLQSTFRQRHDHFDSKQTHLHKHTHTCTPATFQATFCCLPQCPRCSSTCAAWFLTDASTCQCTALNGDSQSVSVGPSTCLSTSQLPALSSLPLPTHPTPHRLVPHHPLSFSLARHTLPDGPHTFSDPVLSVLPVPLCVSTCVYACKYWDQVSVAEGGSAWEHATVLSHRGSGAALSTLIHPTVPPPQLCWKETWWG